MTGGISNSSNWRYFVELGANASPTILPNSTNYLIVGLKRSALTLPRCLALPYGSVASMTSVDLMITTTDEPTVMPS